jgi:DNA-binding XRE family transcriptional regulator
VLGQYGAGRRALEWMQQPKLVRFGLESCRELPYLLHKKYDSQYGRMNSVAHALKIPEQNGPLILSYMDRNGKIAIEQVADGFGMSKGQLAQTAGLARETLYRSERSAAVKTQGRLREMLEIISRVTDWAGGKEQAMAWYRAQPLPAFGGRTAEALVKEGKAAAVRDYLDHMAVGGFA